MRKIFLVYGHYNDQSFNASIKNTFIETAKEGGHQVDYVDLYKEKFNPVFSGENQIQQSLTIKRELNNLILLF